MLTRRIVGIELWPFFEAAEGPAVAELESLSDRAAGIVAVTLVENRLTSGILNQLRDDDDAIVGDLCGNNGPLASLSSKIVMAYALGLLSKRGRQDLDLLRKIRNEFAHNLSHSSFETEAIKKSLHGVEDCRSVGRI